MDSDRIKGQARTAAGGLEAEYGRLAGDDGARAEGLARQVAGRGQAALGQAKDSLREGTDKAAALAEEAYDRGRRAAEQGAHAINDRIEANPVVAILIAGALGYVLGLLARRQRR